MYLFIYIFYILFINRQSIIVLSSIYKVQRAWREYQAKKIRNVKIETRNKAATKIQALWRGYHTRICKYFFFFFFFYIK